MNRIIILATNDFVTDQRVLKVAQVFDQNNYEVLLLGRKVSKEIGGELPFKSRLMRMLFNNSFLFYIEFNLRAFLYLLFSSYSHILSNDTDTLLCGFCGSKLRKKKLIFDAHELFPEVPELYNRKFPKFIWTKLEDYIFPHIKISLTVCKSIADYYYKRYGIQMHVVRNIPLKKSRYPSVLNSETRKIILYQGALNVGRGLEWVIDAMQYVENAVLVIIGNGYIEQELKHRVNLLKVSDKVKFLGRIPGSDLNKYTSSASLGLCLLDSLGLSYEFALPNRVFDYLHAGVPILATDFVEIRRIVSDYNTGKLISCYEPKYLAEVIESMIHSEFDTSHFDLISNELCWQNESKILENIIINHL